MKRLEGTPATVVSYRDSPYHGDLPASLRFAFVGNIDGIITTSTDYFNRSCSGSNCTLVRINATTRSITSSVRRGTM